MLFIIKLTICIIFTIFIVIKIWIDNRIKKDTRDGGFDRGGGDGGDGGYKSIIESLGKSNNKLDILTSLGMTCIVKFIYEIDGNSMYKNILKGNIIKTENGDKPYIQKMFTNLDLYTYDSFYELPDGITSEKIRQNITSRNKICSDISGICDVNKISNTIFNTAMSDKIFSKYIWLDKYTNEIIVTNNISLPLGVNKTVSTSYIDYIPSTDVLFDLIRTYPNGIINGDYSKPIDSVKKNGLNYLPFLKSSNFVTKNVLKTIDLSGDKALISYGYIFILTDAIVRMGSIDMALDYFNTPRVMTSLIDNESGRYLFVISHNKLTERYTVLLHNKSIYRNMQVKDQEELILKTVICKGDSQSDIISCDVTKNDLYRTFKRLRQGSGALKMFDIEDNTLDYIYMDFSINRLVNKKSVFIRYTDTNKIYIDYIIGSGWTESILHSEK
jgi:hypothetical protein